MGWPICSPIAGFSCCVLGSSGRQTTWDLAGLRPPLPPRPMKNQLLSEGLSVIDILIKIADIK